MAHPVENAFNVAADLAVDAGQQDHGGARRRTTHASQKNADIASHQCRGSEERAYEHHYYQATIISPEASDRGCEADSCGYEDRVPATRGRSGVKPSAPWDEQGQHKEHHKVAIGWRTLLNPNGIHSMAIVQEDQSDAGQQKRRRGHPAGPRAGQGGDAMAAEQEQERCGGDDASIGYSNAGDLGVGRANGIDYPSGDKVHAAMDQGRECPFRPEVRDPQMGEEFALMKGVQCLMV
jgi:hypothetical protein